MDLQLPVQSVHITTKVVSSNPVDGEVYLIQHYHYVIKFVSDLLHVGSFLQVLRFPPPIKLTANIVEGGIKHHKPNQLNSSFPSIYLMGTLLLFFCLYL